MDLEIVGRHALLFDDDAAAAFVNSSDALVDWNTLLIDRYDVRHLLSGPPPPRRRRNPQQTHSPPSASSSIESALDHERYLDLPPPSDEQESDEGAKSDDAGRPGGYHNVGFSYGNTDDSSDPKNSCDGLGDSGFRPPFPVPQSLLQNLPPTEKVHQIIARTAIFVSKHGGQSEIVLRVKQGDNPTFGFLMPDHHLHAYFRFLVDHRDLLQSDADGKSETEKKGDTERQTDGMGAGALSLLGSVYGSGEDEDKAVEDVPEAKETVSGKTFDASSATVRHHSGETETSANVDGKDEAVGKRTSPSKEKVQVVKRNSFVSAPKSGTTTSTKKGGGTFVLSAAVDKREPSAPPNMSQVEQLILEPPSDLKRMVDKIVEFIMRHGKQFEAVLIEQDSKHGRFPFLLPSNPYHPYYVKVLQKAQESKLTGKGFLSEKDDSMVNGLDKKSHLSKESDSLSSGSAGYDIPYDGDRKEKFRMVIGKSKKDGQDPPSKATQPQFGVNVDAAAAAAILQAATRGVKNPNFGFFSNTSLNGDSHGRNSDGEQKGESSLPVPLAKDIAKAAALEAANEADSSEAHMTKEQKLKAERLKRAKMFLATLKSGPAPGNADEPLRSLSVEPQETGVSSSGNGLVNLSDKERDGISVPVTVNTADKKEKKYSDEYHERRSKRKYRSKSGIEDDEVEEDKEEEDDVEDEVEEEEIEKDRKNSRKKHQSHRSSQEEEEEDKEDREHRYARKKYRSYHSSHEEHGEEDHVDERDRKHSRKKHRSYHSSRKEDGVEDAEDRRDHKHFRERHQTYRSSNDDDDKEEDSVEERNHKHSRTKKHKSHSSSRHGRDRRHKHKESRRHRRKRESSSDDEHRHHDSSNKHRKRSHSEEELEEGEISSKISEPSRGSGGAGGSREASVALSSSCQDGRAPSEPSEPTEVPDELRAKIRAMLMATL